MRASRAAAVICISFSILACAASGAAGDVIRFKKGGAQKCVVIEETEESVEYLSSMGVIKTPMERIGSIERETDDVNAALEEKWGKKKAELSAPKPKTPKPRPAKSEKPAPLRTYTINITKRRIALGGAVGVQGGWPVSTFVIKDLGSVKGNRVLEVEVTSFRTGVRAISTSDFHALLRNGLRIDPKPFDGYPSLRANLKIDEKASGHVSFPINAKLETLIVRSSAGNFDLDFETGAFSIKGGPF